MYTENPFLADEIRANLAKYSKYNELLYSYDGRFNDLPQISTAKLWEFKSKTMLKTFREKEIRLRYALDFIDQEKTILDWGMGGGEIYQGLKEGNRKNYVGIDVAKSFVESMKKRFPQGNFKTMNLEDIEDNSFFQVCALEVFEHIAAPSLPQKMVKINKIVKDNGYLICSVPLYEQLRFVTFSCPICGSLANKEGHCRSYTPELIKAELYLGGFEVVDYRYVWPVGYDWMVGLYHKIKRILKQGKPVNIVIKARKFTNEPEFKIYER